jgi:alkanesulfonate monooxygenase
VDNLASGKESVNRNRPSRAHRPEEGPVRFALMIEAQQGLSYLDQLAVARRAEAAGFEAMFRSDHYASFPGPSDGPSTDAWAVLAGLARETERIRLGALVSPVTFRHPGSFVKVVTTVDEMSGGRIEVGVGAGWNEADHLPLGLAFPEIAKRADLMEDQLAVLHGLWTEPDGWSFEGHQIRVEGGFLRPKPVDVPDRPRTASGAVRPRIIVGGEGSPRGFRMAARYADEFNLTSSSPERAAERYAALDAACRAADRDPSTLTHSSMIGVMIGARAGELDRRKQVLLEALEIDSAGASEWYEARKARWIMGTPDEARATVRRYAEAGVERIMLQDFLPWDLDMIDLMGAELIGKV